MTSYHHQLHDQISSHPQPRTFGNDLTNYVNEEDASLDNIRKEIHNTLENIKRSQSHSLMQNVANGYSSAVVLGGNPEDQIDYVGANSPHELARENMHKNHLEKRLKKKRVTSEKQVDSVTSGSFGRLEQKKKPWSSRAKDGSTKPKLQNYLNTNPPKTLDSVKNQAMLLKRGMKLSRNRYMGIKEKLVPLKELKKLKKNNLQSSLNALSQNDYTLYQKSNSKKHSRGRDRDMGLEFEAKKRQPSKNNINKQRMKLGEKDNKKSDRDMKMELSQPRPHIEEEQSANPQCVESYQADIFDFCMKKEVDNLCKSNYFVLKQKHINDKMRAILIDWMVDVHNKFRMIPQTLFMTINLIDRFLEIYECERNQLQLVGISSLFLASKYEEIYPPDLKEFVQVCDNTYTCEEIINMESDIISSLNFNLVFTSSYQFHEMFCQKLNIKDQPFHLSLFLLFLSTMEFSMARFRPSQIALSSIYLSNKFLNMDKWREELPQVVGCTEQEIKNCALDLFLLVHKVKRSCLTAILRRFAGKKHMNVSKIQIKL